MSRGGSAARHGTRGRKSHPRRGHSDRWWLIGIVGVVTALGLGSFALAGGLRQAAAPASVATTDSVRRVSPQRARALAEAGDAVLYDTRPRAEYEQEHAMGALSMPLAEIADRLDELATDKTLILYCT